MYKKQPITAQLTIPALQRVTKHSCVVCGRPSELYCSRCELAPYCGSACQRSDWVSRHSAVCHNLVRLSKPKRTSESNVEQESIPPAAPLRKPHTAVNQSAKRDQKPLSNQISRDPEITSIFKHAQHNGENKPTQQNCRGLRKNINNRLTDHKPTNNYQNDKPNTRYPPKPASETPSSPQKEEAPQIKPTPVTSDVPVKLNIPVQVEVPVNVDVPVKTEVPVKVDVKAEIPVKTMKPPGSLTDVLPARKIVPKNYLLETVSIGDFVMVSTDAAASDCNTKQAGFVCLCINVDSEADYQRLCGEFGEMCAQNQKEHSPSPGELFAYFDTSEEAWYRARCLSATKAALIDGCRVATVGSAAQCRVLPTGYDNIPEFCCVLAATRELSLGVNYKAILVSKTANACKVALQDAAGAAIGESEASRWLPEVEYPKPADVAQKIPEVVRPDVSANSTVLLVEATAFDRVLVRPADKESMRCYDFIQQDVILYGQTAEPLKEPPQAGQMVIARYTDGLQYRALCLRTNVKQDKYLLEYVEYGNTEIANLKDLYPCPPELNLSNHPTQVSCVKLQSSASVLTSSATDYLNKLRDDSEELLLTIPSGAKTGPTGTEVCLSIVKNKESVNKRVTEMCTPEWKKMEERGADVLESEVIMNDQITYLAPPVDGCELDVLDASCLSLGTVFARTRGSKHAEFVFGQLAERMAEYCESEIGKTPYLPRSMEVCIAKCPPHPQWFRAVMVEHTPGEQEAKVLFMDCDNIELVPVCFLRKILPEFIKDVPALVLNLEINDFPAEPTADQLARAKQHLNIDKAGRGTLRVRRCEEKSPGVFAVDAPELIAAMHGRV